MTKPTLPLLAAALVSVAALAACSKTAEEQTVGQKLDQAVSQTQQAANEVKGDVTQGTESAQQKAAAVTQELGQAIDDAAITASVSTDLAKDKDLSVLKISVSTKNGVVTLDGVAPTVTARERATSIAMAVKGVTSVSNNLMVRAA